MNHPKDIFYASEARAKMMEGVNKIANAVKVTLGPKGRHVVIDKLYSGPRSTKDGVTVAREVFLSDRFENIGAQMVKQVALKSMDLAGDGTTTSTVLAQTLIQKGLIAVDHGLNPMDLKRGMDLAVEQVVKHLKEHSKPLDTNEQIHQIALISANSDKEIADYITKAYERMGKEGQVSLVEGRKLKTDLDIENGIIINSGYVEPHFVTNIQKNTCELENPLIFFYEQNFNQAKQIEGIMMLAAQLGQPLLIVANDIQGSATSLMVENKRKGIYTSCAVRAPSYDQYRTELIEDMCILTGGMFLPIASGMRLDKKIDDLKAKGLGANLFGRASKAIISHDQTIIIGGKGNEKKIQERKEALENILKELDNSHEVNEAYYTHIVNRLRNFKGMAVIRVGGPTELAMKESYDRYDDALHATKAALAEGISPGGGIALLKAFDDIRGLEDSFINHDIKEGFRIVYGSLDIPSKQIALNAGLDLSILTTIGDGYEEGYDAQTGESVNMIKAGIIDPTKVIRVALEGAASIAGIMITTEAIITYFEEPKTMMPQTVSIPAY